MNHATIFFLGFNVAATVAIGLFFFQFWRRTHDRLFLALGAAFWILSIHWAAVAFFARGDLAVVVYMLRLIAFAVIIAGIIDKNRHRKPACNDDR